MKHSPLIRLANARNALRLARECCPHWDMESDGATAECCDAVADAKHALKLAKKAAEQSE